MASVLIYSDKQKQIWNYGDCRYLLNGKLNCCNNRIDIMSASVRSFVDQAYLYSGISLAELLSHDLGSDAIEEILKLQPFLQIRTIIVVIRFWMVESSAKIYLSVFSLFLAMR